MNLKKTWTVTGYLIKIYFYFIISEKVFSRIFYY